MTEQIPSDYEPPTAPDHGGNVVPLGRAPQVRYEEPEPSRPQGRLHRVAIAGMATCALLGTIAMLVFITVSWPGDTGRYVVAVIVGSGVGFLACASTAVFSAARETYALPRKDEGERRTR